MCTNKSCTSISKCICMHCNSSTSSIFFPLKAGLLGVLQPFSCHRYIVIDRSTNSLMSILQWSTRSRCCGTQSIAHSSIRQSTRIVDYCICAVMLAINCRCRQVESITDSTIIYNRHQIQHITLYCCQQCWLRFTASLLHISLPLCSHTCFTHQHLNLLLTFVQCPCYTNSTNCRCYGFVCCHLALICLCVSMLGVEI